MRKAVLVGRQTEEEIEQEIKKKQQQKQHTKGGEIPKQQLRQMCSMLEKAEERSNRFYNFAKCKKLPAERRAKAGTGAGEAKSGSGSGSASGVHKAEGKKLDRSWVTLKGLGGVVGFLNEIKQKAIDKDRVKWMTERKQMVMPEGNSRALEGVRDVLGVFGEAVGWVLIRWRGASSCAFKAAPGGSAAVRSAEETAAVDMQAIDMQIKINTHADNAYYQCHKDALIRLGESFTKTLCEPSVKALPGAGEIRDNTTTGRDSLSSSIPQKYLGSDDENEAELSDSDDPMEVDEDVDKVPMSFSPLPHEIWEGEIWEE